MNVLADLFYAMAEGANRVGDWCRQRANDRASEPPPGIDWSSVEQVIRDNPIPQHGSHFSAAAPSPEPPPKGHAKWCDTKVGRPCDCSRGAAPAPKEER